MPDRSEKPTGDTPRPADERAERLAAALRENLKRRKAQARGRRAAEAGDTEPGVASPPEASRPGDARPEDADPATTESGSAAFGDEAFAASGPVERRSEPD